MVWRRVHSWCNRRLIAVIIIHDYSSDVMLNDDMIDHLLMLLIKRIYK